MLPAAGAQRDTYQQCVRSAIGEPVADPGAWTTITWDNGGPEPFSLRLRPEEVFTGEQAAPVFRAYIEDGTLPPAQLLRRLDV